MSRAHVLVARQGRAQGHWKEAFNSHLTVVLDVGDAIRVAKAGDVVWMDVLDSAAMAQVRKARPELALVAVSLNPHGEEGMRAFEAGARGYCHMLAVPALLRQVSVVVSNGGLWVGADLMSRAVAAVTRGTVPQSSPSSPLDSLTPRERDVAVQVGSGASNKEIARTLKISLRTVKAHMGAIFGKLEVRDRLQLVLLLRSSAKVPADTV